MRFLCFHLMPWPYLPADFEETERSAWVSYSNAHYDPELGHALYERYIDELCLAEEVGFDGICVNEHHQTAYGLMPSPNLIAGMLVQRTKQVKIALLGNAIPLHNHPLRVAEEVAMLDVISGGRIICGFVRGIGPEYHTFTMNPADSLERFREAHDLIVKAWTEPGPFAWEGKHYQLQYANPWPRPLQTPHPPIWLPSQGSTETVEWAAKRRYPFLMTFAAFKNIVKGMKQYRDATDRNGHRLDPKQLGWSVPVYVGRTDEEALAEVKPHVEYLFNTLVKRPLPVFFPPGYLSEASTSSVLRTFRAIGTDRMTAERLNENGQLIVGSEETVRERLRECIDRAGIETFVALLQIGTMPHEMTVASMERFAKGVMEPLRDYRSAIYTDDDHAASLT